MPLLAVGSWLPTRNVDMMKNLRKEELWYSLKTSKMRLYVIKFLKGFFFCSFISFSKTQVHKFGSYLCTIDVINAYNSFFFPTFIDNQKSIISITLGGHYRYKFHYKDSRERVAFSKKKATMTQNLLTTPKDIYT